MLSFSFIFLLVVTLQNICVHGRVTAIYGGTIDGTILIQGIKGHTHETHQKPYYLGLGYPIKLASDSGSGMLLYKNKGPLGGTHNVHNNPQAPAQFESVNNPWDTRTITLENLSKMVENDKVMLPKGGSDWFKVEAAARFQDADYYNYGAARAQDGDYYYSGEYEAEEQGVSAYTDGFRRGYDYAMSRLLRRDNRY